MLLNQVIGARVLNAAYHTSSPLICYYLEPYGCYRSYHLLINNLPTPFQNVDMHSYKYTSCRMKKLRFRNETKNAGYFNQGA